jgi:hypothetical protein
VRIKWPHLAINTSSLISVVIILSQILGVVQLRCKKYIAF